MSFFETITSSVVELYDYYEEEVYKPLEEYFKFVFIDKNFYNIQILESMK